MALGFGFNKAKVLSAAEKFVQQGKLQNAIAEYEKVIREDPKDLTVLNTIGDLYARVGQNDKACDYFKRVGDQYAQNGFTVKAIAIFKKLTKLNPGTTETITKLAELYTQQGLFNDARSQYMQVADQLLKSGDNHQAARVFQKILELDPENTTTQSKLADLYIKLGKKEEARNIYYSAAESLYARSSFDAADEALSRVLSLDPANSSALLLRGMIAAESGDSQAAIQYLEQVPDIDSRADALRALLKAKLRAGSADGIEPLASKLFTVHHDISGISSLAEWYLNNDHLESALKLYENYADRFLAHGPNVLQDTIYPLISRVRNSPEALNFMLRLLQKAGDTSHVNEVMELLAHAQVQKGDFAQARDLYRQLAELEPENPLHTQNYKQMLARLGQDAAVRPLSADEGSQALMVEELEHTAHAVHQEYTEATERALEAALTDAELFVSYNVPLKAIVPLEAALPLAPHDVALNQQLASLYIRAERFGDAAKVCQTLSEVFTEAGHPAEAERYADAAHKYKQRAAAMPTPAAVVITPEPVPAPVAPVIPEEPPAPPDPKPTVQEFALDVPAQFETPVEIETAPPVVPEEPTVTAFGFEAEPAVSETATAHEIDLSQEWENMFSVDHEPAPAGAAEVAAPVVPDSAAIADKIQEVQFYISQSFWDIARAAISDLIELAPDTPEIEQLEAALAAARSKAGAPAETPVAAAEPEPAIVEAEPEPAVMEAEPEKAEPVVHEFVLNTPEPIPAAVDEVPKVTAAEPAEAPLPSHEPEPVASVAKKSDDLLGDLVLDLEESLGTDFFPATAAKPAPVLTPDVPAAVPAAAASVALTPSFVPAPVSAAPEPQPAVMQAASASTVPVTNGELQGKEASSVLSDILSELQDEMQEAEPEPEDPETHYNLGIAFKEMGLLDEAIGELQKVCHAVERGHSFSQPIQAYTWLAQCLVDKGVPEAAVRWYQQALNLPGLDHNSRCSIYYDLGSAYESFGDRKAALNNFMEVYSSNIDFRDVASRIKVLKS